MRTERGSVKPKAGHRGANYTVTAGHAAEGSHYEAELRNGPRLPVGRTRYKELREKLQ